MAPTRLLGGTGVLVGLVLGCTSAERGGFNPGGNTNPGSGSGSGTGTGGAGGGGGSGGSATFVQLLGGKADDWLNDVEPLADGGFVVVGATKGGVNIGNQHIASDGLQVGVVAAFDASGKARWARRIGGDQNVDVMQVAVDASGDVFVAGIHDGDAIVDGKLVKHGGGEQDAFVVRLEPAAGKAQWVTTLSGEGTQTVQALVAAEGRVLLAGGTTSLMKVSGLTLGVNGVQSGYLVALSGEGKLEWSSELSGDLPSRLYDLAVMPDKQLFVRGAFTETAQFDNSLVTAESLGDIVEAIVTSDGLLVDVEVVGGGGDDLPLRSAFGSDGRFVKTGFYELGTGPNFGKGELDVVGDENAWVAWRDGDIGALGGTRAIGGVPVWIGCAAIDPLGGFLVGGYVGGNAVLWKGQEKLDGVSSGFLTQLDKFGKPIFDKRLEPDEGGSVRIVSCAADQAGGVIAVGAVDGSILAPQGKLGKLGDLNMLLLRFAR